MRRWSSGTIAGATRMQQRKRPSIRCCARCRAIRLSVCLTLCATQNRCALLLEMLSIATLPHCPTQNRCAFLPEMLSVAALSDAKPLAFLLEMLRSRRLLGRAPGHIIEQRQCAVTRYNQACGQVA